ncbi:MAG TPA: hypothetical protein VIX86_02100 [Streptosporangiaceae bacterium]
MYHLGRDITQRGVTGEGVRPQSHECLLKTHAKLHRDHPSRLMNLDPGLRHAIKGPVARESDDAGGSIQQQPQSYVREYQRVGEFLG